MNNLTSLDVSTNTALTAINCSNNDITSLDVTNNPLLSNFSCDNNDIASLDVSNCTNLLYFVCHYNNLTSIDVSNCTPLSWFSCSGNAISTLDLSNNIALGNLYCAQTDLTMLDLAVNTTLQAINASDCDLSILNITNGNNANFSSFNTIGNPNLTCIQVDDAAWSTTNWTNIDGTSSFSEDCGYPLAVNEIELNKDLSLYPNPSSSKLTIELEEVISSISIFDAMGNVIQANLTSSNSIDVSELSNGVYVLQVETEKGVARQKFIKD
jgi:hypothetical protein